MTFTPYYHFVGETLRDGRPVPPDGEWLVHEGPVELCKSGLHFSPSPWDALQYAPGPILCLVEMEDIVALDLDKGVGRRRKIHKRVDLTEGCRSFAREQALSVLHLWDAPDVIRQYLETGDESLRASAGDAGDAARAARAARAAARAARAAGAAAWAAWAAWAAAGAAARDADRDAAWAAWDAARYAAWAAGAAAGAAAMDAARDRFNALALAALEAA